MRLLSLAASELKMATAVVKRPLWLARTVIRGYAAVATGVTDA